ncbi:MAG TPA: phosphate ABC transporter permease subunit PstC [Verrucomicrobiales bacterium]|nr:phosphate ABC transporter permease subunit PstC [Verrucomicrobiales bacterium]
MASAASIRTSWQRGIVGRGGRFSPTRVASWAFTLLAGAFLASLVAVFVWQGLPAWRQAGFGYITGKQWFYRQQIFGTLSMIYGTVAVSLVALVCAVPIGIGAALCTAEFLPPKPRLFVKVTVELLAGIPSVVYGLLGILFLRDWVYQALTPFDPLSGDTLLTAGLLVGVMILPTILSLADDALRGVPALQRQAARGLGLNRSEVVWSVVLPQAAPGIVAAVLLALGRSLGEMIAVFLVVGRQDNQWPESLASLRPLISAGQTLSSKLGGSETNIAYGDSLHWAAMVNLGLLLLAMVTVVTLLAFRLLKSDRHA